jgi:hypothetical protein
MLLAVSYMARCNLYDAKTSSLTPSFLSPTCSSSKAIEVLEAYEGTLEDDYPPENERYEHGEMLLYKVPTTSLTFLGWNCSTSNNVVSIRLQLY